MEEDFGSVMSEANTAGLVVNSKHIAKFAVRSDPQPLPATSVTLAYGNWAIPKLVRRFVVVILTANVVYLGGSTDR